MTTSSSDHIPHTEHQKNALAIKPSPNSPIVLSKASHLHFSTPLSLSPRRVMCVGAIRRLFLNRRSLSLLVLSGRWAIATSAIDETSPFACANASITMRAYVHICSAARVAAEEGPSLIGNFFKRYVVNENRDRLRGTRGSGLCSLRGGCLTASSACQPGYVKVSYLAAFEDLVV